MMTKTLSLCITDNAPLASGLAEYHLVPQLVTLLSCPTLDPRNRLCVVLAVGHCTESCEEHQSQLLRAGGLPLMIQLLAESQDEELKRAATFVLQTCKQMTSTLGAVEASSPPQADPGGLQEWARPFIDMPSYWRSALEIKERIKQLEKQHREVDEGKRDATNSTDKRRGLPGVETPLLTLDPTAGFWEGTGVQRTLCRGEERGLAHEGYKDPIESRELTPARPALQPYRHQKREGNSRSPVEYPMGPVKRQIFQASAAAETLTPPQSPLAGRQGDRGVGGGRPEPQRKARSSPPQPPGGASQPREPAEQRAAVCSVCSRMPDSSTPPATGGGRERDGEGGPPTAPPESLVIFRRPYPAKTTTEGQNRSSFKGCTLGVSPANSRTFTQILRSCRYRCDRHTVLMDAEDRFKMRVRETIRKEVHNSHWERCRQIRLTPMRKGSCLRNDSTDPLNKADPGWICLTPVKKARTLIDKNAYHREGATSKKRQETESRDEHTPNVSERREPMRRERKNFTQDEVRYLLDGVKKLGPCWNSILWSYPFQKGRTNVDLAKKFSRLQREIPHTQSLES
ncbi:hypothetical protein AGOR_G00167670 [Albula goreensis]|uniref:Myb-like domain-containing protein n=1 Tax=Albula goreensis TaxID=1534307 RepID=A0A8T3D1P5_9TELE|nr:hypothetical protein AGOR_G00167670 [Albula goreensis]